MVGSTILCGKCELNRSIDPDRIKIHSGKHSKCNWDRKMHAMSLTSLDTMERQNVEKDVKKKVGLETYWTLRLGLT